MSFHEKWTKDARALLVHTATCDCALSRARIAHAHTLTPDSTGADCYRRLCPKLKLARGKTGCTKLIDHVLIHLMPESTGADCYRRLCPKLKLARGKTGCTKLIDHVLIN